MNNTKRYFLILLFLGACNSAEKNSLEGFRYLSEGKDMHAYRYFEEALRQNKNYPLALYGKGILLFKDPSTVFIARDMLIQAIPDLEGEYKTGAYLELAKFYRKYNLQGEAVTVLKEAIDAEAADSKTYLALADNYIDLRKYSLAERNLEKALELYPHDAMVLRKAAQFESSPQGHFQDAIKLYEELLKVVPDDIVTVRKLAVLYYLEKDVPQSLVYLVKLRAMETTETSKEEVDDWIALAKKKKWKPSLTKN